MDYEKKMRKNERKESAHIILVAVLLSAHFTTLVQGGYGEVFHNLIGSLAVLEGSVTIYKMTGWKLSKLWQRIRLLLLKKEKTPVLLLSHREVIGYLPAPQNSMSDGKEKNRKNVGISITT